MNTNIVGWQIAASALGGAVVALGASSAVEIVRRRRQADTTATDSTDVHTEVVEEHKARGRHVAAAS